jgi:hypothetical protein
VYAGGAAASLADLQVAQIIAAEGDFSSRSGNYASRIYILQNRSPGVAQELTVFDPGTAGDWDSFEGPTIRISPTTALIVDGGSVPVAGFTMDESEIAIVDGTLVFDTDHNPGGLLTASRVEISHLLDGPVESVDMLHGQLLVLGITVLVGGSPVAYNIGDRVRVSGRVTASGQIAPSLISPSSATGDYLVDNFVSAVDPANKRVTIGSLVVNYGAASLKDFAGADPRAGDRVRIRGRRTASSLVATSVAYMSPTLPAPVGALASLHGLVTSVSSNDFVRVDGFQVTLSADALTACGYGPALGASVTLDGSLLSDGQILADDFCFDPPPPTWETNLSITGKVASIDPKFGTLSILGFAVQPTMLTGVFDGTGVPLSLGDIRVGDTVLAEGAPGTVDVVFADYLTRYAAAPPSTIDARNDRSGEISFADPIVVVAGHPIATDANTTFSYSNPSHTVVPMSRDLFFSNPHHFPFWDRICTPKINFTVDQRIDGSLIATSILWEPDYC